MVPPAWSGFSSPPPASPAATIGCPPHHRSTLAPGARTTITSVSHTALFSLEPTFTSIGYLLPAHTSSLRTVPRIYDADAAEPPSAAHEGPPRPRMTKVAYQSPMSFIDSGPDARCHRWLLFMSSNTATVA